MRKLHRMKRVEGEGRFYLLTNALLEALHIVLVRNTNLDITCNVHVPIVKLAQHLDLWLSRNSVWPRPCAKK